MVTNPMDNHSIPPPSPRPIKATPRSDQQPGRGRPSSRIRWISIAVRTGHIGVASILFGGLILLVPFDRLTLYHHLTIATGCALLFLEWLHDRHWPHRGKGLLALFHLGLCLLIHLNPNLTVPLLWLILVSGCIGSHMPRRYRHWSVLSGWELADRTTPRI